MFSHISPIHYAFNNLAQLQLGNSEYPEQREFLEFLDIERDYWFGIMCMGILIFCAQLLAIIMLKALVSKFQ